MKFGIIDAHMHLGESPDYLTIDAALDTLLRQMDMLNIEYAISANILSLKDMYLEGVKRDRAAFDQSNGRIYGFFYFSPHHADESLKIIRDHRPDPVFRGIKIHPSGDYLDADSEAYRPVWEIANELKLPILTHSWNYSVYHPSQRGAVPSRFEKYVAEYPNVKLVLGHSGGRYDGILEAVQLGKKYKNCFFDIAGDIWGNGVLEHLVENIGPDRVLYGSDCYMIEHRPMLGVVLGSNLPLSVKEKVLRHNAAHVYFQDVPGIG